MLNNFWILLNQSFFSPKPAEDKPEEDEETPWSEQAPEILHLGDATFDEALKEHSSILIMFYAPCMNNFYLFLNMLHDTVTWILHPF